MSLDFNAYDEQREFSGPIPPGTMVKVRMTVRQPEQQNVGHHPLVTRSKTSTYEFLDCEFEVLAGTYQGSKFWENFGVAGATTKGQEQGLKIAGSTLRAILEAVRGIDPKDQSPAARQARTAQDWADFNHLEFPVVIGCAKPKAGDKYINNVIRRVLTVDKEQYQAIMAGGEILSSEPIPELPQAAPQAQAPSAWGQPAAQPAPAQAPSRTAQPPVQGQFQTGVQQPMPAWAAPAQQSAAQGGAR